MLLFGGWVERDVAEVLGFAGVEGEFFGDGREEVRAAVDGGEVEFGRRDDGAVEGAGRTSSFRWRVDGVAVGGFDGDADVGGGVAVGIEAAAGEFGKWLEGDGDVSLAGIFGGEVEDGAEFFVHVHDDEIAGFVFGEVGNFEGIGGERADHVAAVAAEFGVFDDAAGDGLAGGVDDGGVGGEAGAELEVDWGDGEAVGDLDLAYFVREIGNGVVVVKGSVGISAGILIGGDLVGADAGGVAIALAMDADDGGAGDGDDAVGAVGFCFVLGLFTLHATAAAATGEFWQVFRAGVVEVGGVDDAGADGGTGAFVGDFAGDPAAFVEFEVEGLGGAGVRWIYFCGAGEVGVRLVGEDD